MTATSSDSPSRWFRRATVWIPTWRTWVAAALGSVVVCLALGRPLHQFLSLQAPVSADVLIVEGWLPDYALEVAVEEYRARGAGLLVVSGGPVEKGALVSGYPTYAALAGETLKRLGVAESRLLVIPAPKTLRNRTWESAVAVHTGMDSRRLNPRAVNVVTRGTHARRTRDVYRKVFGPDVAVGVICVPSQDYEPERWWASSQGSKETLTEVLGWLYEWLIGSGR